MPAAVLRRSLTPRVSPIDQVCEREVDAAEDLLEDRHT
jgi:hypothetical protein